MSLGDIITTYPNGSYPITEVELFAQGSRILLTNDEKAVVWDVKNEKIISEMIHSNVSSLNDVSVSNDEKKVVSCGADSLKVWEIDSGNLITDFNGHTSSLRKAVFSADDNKVISASDNEILVWEIATSNILLEFTDFSGGIYCLSLSKDGTKAASSGYEEDIKIWDVVTGDILQTLSGHTDYTTDLDFSPEGDKLLSSSYDGTVKYWDINNGEVIKEFSQHTGRVNTCCFFPDGKRAVTGSDDNKVFIWDIENDTVLYSKEDYVYYVESVHVSKHGTKLAVGEGLKAEVLDLINAGGLFLTNKYGQIYNTDFDYLQVPVDLGRILITEPSNTFEMQFVNNKKLPVKDVNITTDNENVGTDLTFSKNISPFDDEQSLIFTGPYNPGEKDTFYIKLNTDLEAAKGEGSLTINADAEFAY